MSSTGAEGQALHAVPEVATEKQTVAQAVRDAMLEEMERDERVIVLGEDVGVDGGVFRATDGLIERFGAERVIVEHIGEVAEDAGRAGPVGSLGLSGQERFAFLWS